MCVPKNIVELTHVRVSTAAHMADVNSGTIRTSELHVTSFLTFWLLVTLECNEKLTTSSVAPIGGIFKTVKGHYACK